MLRLLSLTFQSVCEHVVFGMWDSFICAWDESQKLFQVQQFSHLRQLQIIAQRFGNKLDDAESLNYQMLERA